MGDLTITGSGPLVTISGKNVIRKYKKLAELGGELVERHDEMSKASAGLSRLRYDKGYISSPIELPDEREVSLTDYDRDQIARAQALYNALNPEAAYNGDDVEDEDDAFTLKRDVIGDQLALFARGFLSGDKVTVPEDFAMSLIDHVDAADVTFVALLATCIHLQDDRATIPSIAVFTDVLVEQQAVWDKRRSAIFQLPHLSRTSLENLHAVRDKVAAAQRADAVRNATQAVFFARRDLVALQEQAAQAAQKVAAAFEKLEAAERKLHETEAAP
jgi:hypothetical protein